MLDNEPGILVGGSEHDFYDFPYIGIIIPAGSYFSEGLKPPPRAINSVYQLACTLLKMPQRKQFSEANEPS